LMGQWLSERLGQSFFVENRPGGATSHKPWRRRRPSALPAQCPAHSTGGRERGGLHEI
jgi:hypothetical protein